mgnify:CR=1 FL=1
MSDTDLSYSQVLVGSAIVGLVGLQEALEGLAAGNVPADAPDVGARLVAEIKKHNYIAPRAVARYEAALAAEYRRFLETRASGKGIRSWSDARKEHQPWFPTIFEAKCDGCGVCLEVCPRDVLDWNADKTKVLVWQPYECAPACQLCAKACPRKAISMPPLAVLHRRVEAQGASAADPCAGCSQSSCQGCNVGGAR